uniref:XPG N-terminal domain-containing protein n=1 Tax=Lotus japonicus TaxID=34305 RepID=I3T203_LOTJA|nr:unknown [Lotus japonicus]
MSWRTLLLDATRDLHQKPVRETPMLILMALQISQVMIKIVPHLPRHK